MKRFFAICLTLLISLNVFAEKAIPNWIDTWVVDQADILTPNQENQINAYCKAIEEKTSIQFGILTVDSLEGEDIERFAVRVFEKWKLGQEGKDNGCLFIISVSDREYRIEVGYGLEGSLTDLKTGIIGREIVEPKLSSGDWSGGIMTTLKALYETASNEVLEDSEAYSDINNSNYTLSQPEENSKTSKWKIIIIIIIVILVFLDIIFNDGAITFAILSASSSSGGSHHSGGGGRSGGGGHSGRF